MSASRAQARRPLSRRAQAYVMRAVNLPMRWVLGLPVTTPLSHRLMLAFITGRRTGRTYVQPLSYVAQGPALLTPGGGNWKLNLVDGRPVRLRIGGRDVHARPEMIGDIDEVERLLEVMIQANPSVARFTGVGRGADGRLDRTQLQRAVAYGFRIVRWQLDATPGS